MTIGSILMCIFLATDPLPVLVQKECVLKVVGDPYHTVLCEGESEQVEALAERCVLKEEK